MPTDRADFGAEVISFASAARYLNRFTTADRMDVLQWEALDQGGVRLAIHKRRDDDPPELGEFASIYPPNDRWAAWCAVRQGRAIQLWRAGDGRDVGCFATMGEALHFVSASRASQSAGRYGRGDRATPRTRERRRSGS